VADVSVRAARAEDAAEIARLQIDTWRTAYATVLPSVVLDALDAELSTAAWREAITAPPSPQHHVLVAVEQEWTVGFTALGPPAEHEPDDPEPERTVALSPLLVEPRWGRRGHGSRLLAAAVDHARADGMVRAVIWLPEGDNASRTFFGSAGWEPDGLVRALDTGAGELREIRIHTDLGTA
jgi:GNAT superfamily N-acetyltransferase